MTSSRPTRPLCSREHLPAPDPATGSVRPSPSALQPSEGPSKSAPRTATDHHSTRGTAPRHQAQPDHVPGAGVVLVEGTLDLALLQRPPVDGSEERDAGRSEVSGSGQKTSFVQAVRQRLPAPS
jgi:hypothetical protein